MQYWSEMEWNLYVFLSYHVLDHGKSTCLGTKKTTVILEQYLAKNTAYFDRQKYISR